MFVNIDPDPPSPIWLALRTVFELIFVFALAVAGFAIAAALVGVWAHGLADCFAYGWGLWR